MNFDFYVFRYYFEHKIILKSGDLLTMNYFDNLDNVPLNKY
jgi:hypothetical protein